MQRVREREWGESNAELCATPQGLIKWDLYYRKWDVVRRKRLEHTCKLNPQTGEESK